MTKDPSRTRRTGAAANPVLQLEGVTKRYPKGTVVGPVSLDVHEGQFVSLLGPSGCGKTTILRSIAGFESIEAGRIRVAGQDVSAMPAHRRDVGLVFQSYALFPHLTALENVAFGLRFKKRAARSEVMSRSEKALASVGLAEYAERRPDQLSGGQQQRVAIARSLVLDPAILLLDEPLSNLDLQLRHQMRQELISFQRDIGTTFVYVTHDQTEALAMSDQVVVLNAGHIEQVGTPEEVYTSPRTRFVASFIGSSNLLPATAERSDGVRHSLVFLGGPAPARAEHQHPVTPGENVLVSIRPEDLVVRAEDDDDETGMRLRGRTVSATYHGDRVEVEIELDRDTAADTRTSPASGSLVRAYLRADASVPSRVSVSLAPSARPVVVEDR